MLRFALLAVLLGGAAPALAQPRPGDPPTADQVVTWEALLDKRSVRRGEEVTLTLTARIAAGWKLYAMDSQAGRPLEVRLNDDLGGFRRTAGPTQSRTFTDFDDALGMDYTYFAGQGTVTLRFRANRNARRGRHTLGGSVRFAVCSDEICLPPKQATFAAPVHVR
ncbi:MAG TPA: protein-disulfide reductase DsbD domain-containing protein [Rubricoccaceae bacterium]|nr:protein-disulfide reductase DsbD domain-containing protein [Rubricoccaceae bacterium]